MLALVLISSYLLIGGCINGMLIRYKSIHLSMDVELQLLALALLMFFWPFYSFYYLFIELPISLLEKKREKETQEEEAYTLYKKLQHGDEDALLQWDKLPKRIKLKVLNNLV